MFTDRRKKVDAIIGILGKQSFADFYDKLFIPYIEGEAISEESQRKVKLKVLEEVDFLFEKILPEESEPRRVVWDENQRPQNLAYLQHVMRDEMKRYNKPIDLLVFYDLAIDAYVIHNWYFIYPPSLEQDKHHKWILSKSIYIPATFDTPDDWDEQEIGEFYNFRESIEAMWKDIAMDRLNALGDAYVDYLLDQAVL